MTDSHNTRDADTPGTLRLFIAIPLPDEIREQVARLSENLRKGCQFSGCQMSWASIETIHLTLIFLGARPAEQVGPIARVMREVASGFAPPRLEIKRLGVFPHWHSPRILWAGVRDRSHQLVELHRLLEQRLAAFGYEPEDRDYSPHLTLARFKSLKGAHSVEKIVQDHTTYKYGPFFTPQMVLFKSTLDPQGAVHTALQRINFERSPVFGLGGPTGEGVNEEDDET